MPVTELNSAADLAAALKANKSKLVMVDFFATWCGPCKAIAPHVDTLSTRYAKEAAFYKVDVDKVPDVAKEAGVQAMPSFGFYGDGKLVELMKGADPRGLEERVKKYSAQFFKSPFTSGAGYSLSGSTRPTSAVATASTGAAAASGGAGAGGGSQPARKNPWADPNFFPAKKGAATSAAASTPATTSASSTIPAASKLLNPSAASSSPVPSSTAASTTASTSAADLSVTSDPSAPASTTDPSSTATAAAPSAASTSSHPALQVKPELLQQLRDMGFTDVRAQKALLFTGNKDAEDALNWLVEHQDDADIDEELQVVGVEKKEKETNGLPAGVNIDDLDEDAQVLYADLMKRRAKEQSTAKLTTAATASKAATTAAASSTANSGQKPVSEMNSEEKRQWLEDRKAAVKVKKETEALEKVKSDYKSTKGMTTAMNDLKEQREEFERQQAMARKAKEQAEKAKQRRDIQEKIAADKERRRVEQEKTMAALQKAKAEKAANGGK